MCSLTSRCGPLMVDTLPSECLRMDLAWFADSRPPAKETSAAADHFVEGAHIVDHGFALNRRVVVFKVLEQGSHSRPRRVRLSSGKVTTDWAYLSGSEVRLTMSIPANTTATVTLPAFHRILLHVRPHC